MAIRNIFRAFAEIWLWVVRFVTNWVDPIRPPTKNLSEIARIENEKKLANVEIAFSNNCEPDVVEWLRFLGSLGFDTRGLLYRHTSANKYFHEGDLNQSKVVTKSRQTKPEIRRQSKHVHAKPQMHIVHQAGDQQGDSEIRRLDTSFTSLDIEFVRANASYETIRIHSTVFGESFFNINEFPNIETATSFEWPSGWTTSRKRNYDKKLVSVRKSNENNTKHFEVVAKLSHHENILSHLFDFETEIDRFVVSENFKYILPEFILTEYFLPDDLKHLTRHLCNGLEYLHGEGIAHGSIKGSNVVVCIHKNQKIYKIANFEKSTIETDSELLMQDVKDFGKLLLKLRNNINDAQKQENYRGLWDVSDNSNLTSLLQMIVEGSCSIEMIKQHPFLWTSHETLMFVIEIVKMMEPHVKSKKYSFINKTFKTCTDKVLRGEDWRSRALNIVEIQTKQNYGKKTFDNLLGLLKTIRNLAVHHKSDEVVKIVGFEEHQLLSYWTEKFPNLVTELYSTKKLQLCKRAFR